MNEGKQNLHKIQKYGHMQKREWMMRWNPSWLKNGWRAYKSRNEEMRPSKVQEWSNRTAANANRKQWALWISKQEWQKLECKWMKRWDCTSTSTSTVYWGVGLLKANEWNKGSSEGASVKQFDSWGGRTGAMRFLTHEWNNWTLHDTPWGNASTEAAWQKQYIRPLSRSGKTKITVN